MAQEDKKGKYVGIQLEEYVDSKKWAKHTINHTSNNQEWGVKANIDYQLDPRYQIDDLCFSDWCSFYHRQIKFELFIGTTDGSENAHVRLCYIPISWSLRNCRTRLIDRSYNSHNHISACRSHFWALNNCFVKIHIQDVNNPANIVTKILIGFQGFQLEINSGGCGNQDHETSPAEEYAHYRNNEFIKKSELEREISYKMEPSKDFFPVKIEIDARVNLVTVNHGILITDLEKHRETSPESYSFNIAKLIIPVANNRSTKDFCFGKPSKFFFEEPDVVFAIEAKPSPILLDAHSCFLKGQSPVFSKMLSANWIEQKSGMIKIKKDVDKEAMQVFLKMIYERSGWIYKAKDEEDNAEIEEKLSIELVLKVLQLAHMYDTVGIIDFCLDNLINRPDSELTFELAVEMSKAGQLCNENNLGSRSSQWFKSQMRTDRRSQLREQAKMLLQQDPSNENIEFVGQLL